MSAKITNRVKPQLTNLENRETPASFQVMDVTFGDGSVARSSIKQIVIRMDTPIAFDGELGTGSADDAITLTRRIGDKSDLVKMRASQNDLGNFITLSEFAGSAADETGSLADGCYDIYINARRVTGGDASIDGKFDARESGGDYFACGECGTNKNNFFRLAGDVNGDGVVSQKDTTGFRSAFGTANDQYDMDGDGVVTSNDLQILRDRYGVRL